SGQVRHAANNLSHPLEQRIGRLEYAGSKINADREILMGLRVGGFLAEDLAVTVGHRGTGDDVLVEGRVGLEDGPGGEESSSGEAEESELMSVERKPGGQQRDHFGREG